MNILKILAWAFVGTCFAIGLIIVIAVCSVKCFAEKED